MRGEEDGNTGWSIRREWGRGGRGGGGGVDVGYFTWRRKKG